MKKMNDLLPRSIRCWAVAGFVCCGAAIAFSVLASTEIHAVQGWLLTVSGVVCIGVAAVLAEIRELGERISRKEISK